MAVLERKIIHDRTTLCSLVPYPQFILPRHKHVEYEIMLFTHGSGKQFVGEGVADYQEGDVAMIGSNVPHLHLCNTKLNPIAISSDNLSRLYEGITGLLFYLRIITKKPIRNTLL